VKIYEIFDNLQILHTKLAAGAASHYGAGSTKLCGSGSSTLKSNFLFVIGR
jgi:hypothetical protein